MEETIKLKLRLNMTKFDSDGEKEHVKCVKDVVYQPLTFTYSDT